MEQVDSKTVAFDKSQQRKKKLIIEDKLPILIFDKYKNSRSIKNTGEITVTFK